MRRPWLTSLAATLLTLLFLPGCSRHFYRRDADAEVRSILAEKEFCEPYVLPGNFNVYPDPRSRFADPTAADCPRLPSPIPQLSSYQLPPLESGDPTQPTNQIEASLPSYAAIPPHAAIEQTPVIGAEVVPASFTQDNPQPSAGGVPTATAASADNGTVKSAPIPDLTAPVSTRELPQEEAQADDELPRPSKDQPAADGSASASPATSPAAPPADDVDAGGVRIVPIPEEFWETIPAVCLPRMLESDTVREEYRRTFGTEPPASLRSDAPRLSLPNVMELALINARDYQTQKEQLYLAALALTGPRYDFMLRPRGFGNGSSLNYVTENINDTQVSGLSIPTGVGIRKTTATAGQFIASFANDVVLTFNGPQGFSSRVGSELLFDFQQTLFQTDVEFERLTQAERNVVYASRNFIRFRRRLFLDLADQYYQLLLSFRRVAIASQDYFSNSRGYLQAQAEYEFRGRLPRVQVDQFEQNALRSRSALVAACNRLESQLDGLKLAIGLPPEMELNLDLSELEALSASDESTVARELISRARRELTAQDNATGADLTTMINAAIVLLNRIEDIRNLAQKMADDSTSDSAANREADQEYQRVAAMLGVLDAQAQVDALANELRGDQDGNTELLDLQRFGRSIDLSETLLELCRRLVRYRRATSTRPFAPSAEIQTAIQQLDQEDQLLRQTRAEFIDLPPADTVERLPEFVQRASQLRERVEAIEAVLARGILPRSQNDYANLVQRTVQQTLEQAALAISESAAGLTPIEIEQEAAMLSALNTRLDLQNRRGELADQRRGVKLASDDLKSILDLRATHVLRTPGNQNRPFSFSFDDSETSLRLALDTPLNRRLQRNGYRAALIDYNRAIRTLIEAEDNIKFAIRDDLRNLRLRRNQYEIAVKSAALAYERVVSTRLQLQLGTGNVVARDFLEAQQAYTEALVQVAQNHRDFILDRVQLFFNMEAIRLDQLGYWPGMLDEDMQPPVSLDFFQSNPYPYGRLVPGLRYSQEILNTVR